MNTSWSGIKFIAQREALVTVPYRDGGTDASPKFSFGFGNQDLVPPNGAQCTYESAMEALKASVAKRDLIIGNALKVPVTQPQWDGICSLLYQRGSFAMRSVVAYYNNNEPVNALAEFMRWNSGQDGKPTFGHSKRRAREILMSLGDYGDISKYLLFAGDPRVVPGVLTAFPT